MRELRVSAIENGTVIDHIPVENIFTLVSVLNLRDCTEEVLIGTNLRSGKQQKKGVVKIANKILSKEELDKLGILADGAKVNTIENFEVKEKRTITMPGMVEGIVTCFNSNCITHEEPVTSRFTVVCKEPLRLRCQYCEKQMEKETIELR